jgi:hypothetical protein
MSDIRILMAGHLLPGQRCYYEALANPARPAVAGAGRDDAGAGRLDDCSRLFGSHPWVLTVRCFVGISHRYLIGCLRHFSYGIRIGEVRILSPTPAMIIVGLTASPSVM